MEVNSQFGICFCSADLDVSVKIRQVTLPSLLCPRALTHVLGHGAGQNP